MRLDGNAIRERIRSTGRSIKGFAQFNNIDPMRFQHILSNNVVPREKELAVLASYDFLVFEKEDELAA